MFNNACKKHFWMIVTCIKRDDVHQAIPINCSCFPRILLTLLFLYPHETKIKPASTKATLKFVFVKPPITESARLHWEVVNHHVLKLIIIQHDSTVNRDHEN